MHKIQLSVAIVTRNRPTSLERCLKSWRAQTVSPHEIVVSDDSDPLLQAEIEALCKIYHAFYTIGPRRGLYANRNHAALACHGTHIVTGDDDHTHPLEYVERCHELIEEDPRRIWIFMERYPNAPQVPLVCPPELYPNGFGGPPKNPEDCAAIADGSTIYPRALFDSGLRYDETYPFGGMWYLWGKWVKHNGWHISFSDRTFVWHHVELDNRPANKNYIRNQLEAANYAALVNALWIQKSVRLLTRSMPYLLKRIVWPHRMEGCRSALGIQRTWRSIDRTFKNKKNYSQKSLKILLASPTQGKYGGLEASVLALGHWLAKENNFSVRICFKLSGAKQPAPEFITLCQQHPAAKNCYFVKRSSPQLLKHLLWADLVHGQNASPDIVLSTKLLRKPLVLTIYHCLPEKVSVHSLLWRLGTKMAQRCCYISKFMWNNWEPHKKSPNSMCFPCVSHLQEPTIDFENRRGFIFISRWVANKGLEILLPAYRAAQLDPEKWPLRLIGDGPLNKWVQNYLFQHEMKGVEILGFIEGKQKADLIAHSKWLVAPPNWKEPLGITPIEARHVAVPSIITRDGGLPEAAGPSALICEPGDCKGLTLCLQQAGAMCEKEYRKRAQEAKDELSSFLRPLSEYGNIYQSLLHK